MDAATLIDMACLQDVYLRRIHLLYNTVLRMLDKDI
jgi:hypothetical protein